MLQQIPMKFRKITREYYENTFHKLDNLKEMNKSLNTCDLPKFNRGDINGLNRFKQSNESEAVIYQNSLLTMENSRTRFVSIFYQSAKENLLPAILKLLCKIENTIKPILQRQYYHYTKPIKD